MEENIIFEEGYRECYSNWVKSETSLYDIKLLFGTIQEGRNVNANTKIVMSPQHTKALYYMLKEIIAGYEESFGEINIDIKNK